MNNLWPQDLLEVRDLSTPLEILQQQATFLGEMTKNILKGIIIQNEVTDRFQKPFIYDFLINAPTVGNYSYKLLTIEHDIDLYPVLVRVDADIQQEMEQEIEQGGNFRRSKEGITFKSEGDFISGLHEIFNSAKTKKVISSLLQMSKGRFSPPLVVEGIRF